MTDWTRTKLNRRQKLLTAKEIKALPALHSQDGKGMEMKVFVTTRDGVCGIFTTQELAEQYVQSGKADGWFTSEVLDALPEEAQTLLNLRARVYYVSMDLQGNVLQTRENLRMVRTKGEFTAINNPQHKEVFGTIVAKSLEGAVKILTEPWSGWRPVNKIPMEEE